MSEEKLIQTEMSDIYNNNLVKISSDKIKKIKKINKVQKAEPMLELDNLRFTLFPIKHNDLWEDYKKHVKSIWHPEEIDYSADKEDWKTLTNDERFFIEHILAFFAGADGIVMENLMSNFSTEVQLPEARAFYSIQGFMENVHSETYSELIDNYVDNDERKTQLFAAIDTIPCVTKKAEWALKWMDPTKASFAERIVAFSVVEGVFFSGSFCAIFWLKSRGKMCKTLGTSNEFISRDENLHCSFAIKLYNKLVNKLSKDRIHEIFKEAVEIETQFITESIPCKMIGMDSNLMIRYVKHVANFWMNKLYTKSGKHCPNLYSAKNPFDFMDAIGIDGKANFFEKRSNEYSKPTIDLTAYEEIDENF